MLDLKALLTKMLSKGEYKTLLWTNPNPTSAFVGQTVAVDTNYDAYEIVFTGYTGQAGFKKTERLDEDYSILTYITGSTGQVGGVLYAFKRQIWKGASGVGFGDVYSAWPSSNWTRYTANTGIVPYKIYGIKYGGGVFNLQVLRNILTPRKVVGAC